VRARVNSKVLPFTTCRSGSATGALTCNGTVHAGLPHSLGSAEEEVGYKLEKIENGEIFIDTIDLN
jgi:hypothetical protein